MEVGVDLIGLGLGLGVGVPGAAIVRESVRVCVVLVEVEMLAQGCRPKPSAILITPHLLLIAAWAETSPGAARLPSRSRQ